MGRIHTIFLLLVLSANLLADDEFLLPEERAFLDQHPVIRVHNELDWAPHNFNDNGRPRGFSIDYMNLLAEKLGIEVEFVSGPSWSEFVDMVADKELDVMLNIAPTPERDRLFHFTDPYIQLAQSLFIRDDIAPIQSIEELYGKRFAVPKGFYFEETLKQYPDIEVVPVRDSMASIKAVAFSSASASPFS